MPLYPLGFLAALLPLLTINLTYLVSASHGFVEWCVPYWDGCTSISATGRQGPGYFIFKALMIPASILLMQFWYLNPIWLRESGSRRSGWHGVLIMLGFVAGVGMVSHSVFLGSEIPEHRPFRQSGVLAFFGFTYLAQLLITRQVRQIQKLSEAFPVQVNLLFFVMLLDFGIGISHVLAAYLNPDFYEATKHGFAWIFTLLLCLHIFIVANLWRVTDWRVTFRLASGFSSEN